MATTWATRRGSMIRLLFWNAVVAAAMFGTASPASAQAVTPDSACANESAYKSTAGDQKASLTIVNNTGETLQLFWLDYNGGRVFYQPVPAHATTTQETFLTHPWIVANSSGVCYRFLVMTSLQQTVTVDAGNGLPAPEPPPTTERSSSDTNVVAGPAPPLPDASSQKSGGGGGLSSIVLGAGAAAAVAVAAGAYWALHRGPNSEPPAVQAPAAPPPPQRHPWTRDGYTAAEVANEMVSEAKGPDALEEALGEFLDKMGLAAPAPPDPTIQMVENAFIEAIYEADAKPPPPDPRPMSSPDDVGGDADAS